MNIFVLGTLEVSIDIVDIVKQHIELSGIIGMAPRKPTDAVSGYRYLKTYCDQNGFEFTQVQSYSLDDSVDKKNLLALNIDILVVCGWQRLIPGWLIDHCKVCAIGSHGSTRGITGGRGRSPQNWALLLGKKEFYISIFRIDPGIDSGRVIDTRRYALTCFDDIKTSYYKVCWLTAHMIVENIRNRKVFAQTFEAQSGEPKYLPQRLPPDGEIDWSRTAARIHDFVRALSRPYPGAFSNIGATKLTLWRCRPFEIDPFGRSFALGEIVKLFSSGDFLVRTGDGFLLVEEYTFDIGKAGVALKEGMVLPSADFKAQMKAIVERHRARHPELTIADEVLDAI